MLAALALATKAHAASPEVRAVRVTSLDFRPAVRVLTTDDVPPGEVVRDGLANRPFGLLHGAARGYAARKIGHVGGEVLPGSFDHDGIAHGTLISPARTA